MLCEKCNKNQATVHLTEISHNNIKKEVHLCEQCSQTAGLPNQMQFSLAEILSSLIEPMMAKAIKESSDLKCPKCGMNFETFHKKARFGCAHDYIVFRKGIAHILEKIHGNAQHTGKIPKKNESPQLIKEKDLRELQKELEKLVKSEEFEKAAEIRDNIKKLKEKK